MLVLKPRNSVFSPPRISQGTYIIVGGYGSGKSEVAVNLARFYKLNQDRPGEAATIADLDIVNPYFRSREAAQALESLGINSINPKGRYFHADLPIILPQIKGAVESNVGVLILDVGGDDVGARVLSSLADAFVDVPYQLILVLNARRPFTSNVENCLRLMGEVEISSRLKFTGLISNTHLMEHTTPAVVLEGLKLAKEVSTETKLPILFVSIVKELLKEMDPAEIDVPVLPLERLLLKPWEQREP